MDEKKAREMWVNLYSDTERIAGIAHHSEETALADLSESLGDKETVHVIEMSAYTDLKAERDRYKKALEFYANGAPWSEKTPWYEFGCGCCASSAKEEGDRDYNESGDEIQGRVARAALKGKE